LKAARLLFLAFIVLHSVYRTACYNEVSTNHKVFIDSMTPPL